MPTCKGRIINKQSGEISRSSCGDSRLGCDTLAQVITQLAMPEHDPRRILPNLEEASDSDERRRNSGELSTFLAGSPSRSAPVGPVRRRSGSRNRRRSPRVGRRALRGELDSCSFGFARIFSRAGPRLAAPGPATPQGLPTGRSTSLPGRFVSSTWRPGGIIFEA